jgi:hypothetical protein
MNWLRQAVRNWLSQDGPVRAMQETIVASRDSNSINQQGMNFCLYRAVGGHILESRVYNNRTDRHEGTLYMIHEDQDFATQVAQAIMLEQMKL